jgi:hypothetical protein
MKDENGDLLVDVRKILNRSKNCYSQLLNLHKVNDVKKIQMHTAEPLVLDHSPLEVEISILKLREYKLPDSDQISAEMIQGGRKTLLFAIHKLFNCIWNKEELPEQWKESVIVPFHKKGVELTVIIIMGYHCCHLHTKLYRISFHQG